MMIVQLRNFGLMSRDRKRSVFVTAPVLDSTVPSIDEGIFFRVIKIFSDFLTKGKKAFIPFYGMGVCSCKYKKPLGYFFPRILTKTLARGTRKIEVKQMAQKIQKSRINAGSVCEFKSLD